MSGERSSGVSGLWIGFLFLVVLSIFALKLKWQSQTGVLASEAGFYSDDAGGTDMEKALDAHNADAQYQDAIRSHEDGIGIPHLQAGIHVEILATVPLKDASGKVLANVCKVKSGGKVYWVPKDRILIDNRKN